MNPENPIKDDLVGPTGLNRIARQKTIKKDKGREIASNPGLDMAFVQRLINMVKKAGAGGRADTFAPGKHARRSGNQKSGSFIRKADARKKRKRKISRQSKRVNKIRAG